jgi:hypothetical protein
VPIAINGAIAFRGQPGTYVAIGGENGDHDVWGQGTATISLTLPMGFRVTEYAGMSQIAGHRRFAYEFGPTLLAAVATASAAWNASLDCVVVAAADPLDPGAWLLAAPQPPEFPLRWTVAGNPGIVFVPYFSIQHNETFSVYPVIV